MRDCTHLVAVIHPFNINNVVDKYRNFIFFYIKKKKKFQEATILILWFHILNIIYKKIIKFYHVFSAMDPNTHQITSLYNANCFVCLSA